MEQLGQVIYRFSAFARLTDGSLRDFWVEIASPEECSEWESVCRVSCPFLRDAPFHIRGVDAEQALELARRFIESMLEDDVQLVDAEGRPVKLPPVPDVNA